jgi:hypothetical protein
MALLSMNAGGIGLFASLRQHDLDQVIRILASANLSPSHWALPERDDYINWCRSGQAGK